MAPKSLMLAGLAAAGAMAAPAPPSAQVVGGEPASAGEFPFIVSLQKDGSHFCGGTLANKNTVITAAHCSVDYPASAVTVTAGTLKWASGGKTVKVDSITVNPDYEASTTNNDVAIWKLAENIAEDGNTIGYADLVAAGSDPAANSTVTVAGWGTTSSGGSNLPASLLKVSVPIVDRETCASDYSGAGYDITDVMICAGLDAGGKDACQGDSGGPLVNEKNQLTGIVSWGQGCAEPGYPGVYSNVGGLMDFIQQHI